MKRNEIFFSGSDKCLIPDWGKCPILFKIKKEAADSIKAVSAQYGYAPDFLSIRRQTGAATSRIGNINKTNIGITHYLPIDR